MRKAATIRAAVMTYAAGPRSRSMGPPGVHVAAPPDGRRGGRFDGVVHVPVDDLVEAPLVTDGPGVVPGAEGVLAAVFREPVLGFEVDGAGGVGGNDGQGVLLAMSGAMRRISPATSPLDCR